MSYVGHVKNGAIVLNDAIDLPEGAAVRVDFEMLKQPQDSKPSATLTERLAPIIGSIDGLPPDAALNHDHYLYGAPKK
jgi:hypothetical protein